MQIPGIRSDIGFGPDRAFLPDRARFGVDAQHAVRQQQRRHGHAHLTHEVILLRKDRPQHLGNLARRHVLKLFAVKRWPRIAGAVDAGGASCEGRVDEGSLSCSRLQVAMGVKRLGCWLTAAAAGDCATTGGAL